MAASTSAARASAANVGSASRPASLRAASRGPSAVSSRPARLQAVRCQVEEHQAELSSTAAVHRRALLAGAGAGAAAMVAAGALPEVARAVPAPKVLSGSWEQVFLGLEPGVILLDVGFVPTKPLRGFLLGTRQTLLETNDGGRTWEPRSIAAAQEEDFNYRFNSISFNGDEGWIVGKPAILLHTSDGGTTWERVPLNAKLPGNPLLIKALSKPGCAEMTTDQGAIYVTTNGAKLWSAAVEETVSATLNRTVSSGINGASYYTGTFGTVNRSEDGKYVGVSSRGNFYMTWEAGQSFWQPHNRTSARRIQSMGYTRAGGLWLLTRGGSVYFSTGKQDAEGEDEFEEKRIGSRGFGILDVGFRNATEAWAAGGSGSLFVSTDGGETWRREKATDEIAGNLYAVKFMDPSTGFVLGNDGVLLRYIAATA